MLETIQDFLKSVYRGYSVFAYRGGHIIRGRLSAMTDDAMGTVRAKLSELGWLHNIEDIDGTDYLTCTVPDVKMRQRTMLHSVLFLATLLTTLIAGGDFAFTNTYQIIINLGYCVYLAFAAVIGGIAGFAPEYSLGESLAEAVRQLGFLLRIIHRGIPFSFAILTILGAHEMGHYFLARRNGINVTLPFFIPVPIGFGTLGAIIRIRSPLVHRRAIMDVGAAGPLSGAVFAIFFLMLGTAMADVVPLASLRSGMPVFGDSLLTGSISRIFHGSLQEGLTLSLHPFRLAGWMGLLITSINLLPIGQLDGGHIAYAMFGRRQRYLASMAFGMLITMGGLGFLSDFGFLHLGRIDAYWPWLFLAVFVRFMMHPSHPPALDETVKLNPGRKFIGIACIVLLIVSFIPSPITVVYSYPAQTIAAALAR